MKVDLRDVRPSSQTLTGFNGESKEMIGTIRLLVYACEITRTVKFSVIDANVPYDIILRTPWLHVMKSVSSTGHRCVKFPGKDGRIQTLRGDQRASRKLLITTMKTRHPFPISIETDHPLSSVKKQKKKLLQSRCTFGSFLLGKNKLQTA